MATPAEFSYCWLDVLTQHYRLSQFKQQLPGPVQNWLNDCEWTLMADAGQAKVPLLILRTPGRIQLRNPLLLQLAESVHNSWGPLDFSLFSAESQEPVRVLSQTLVDINRRQ
ncbi:hypothetical protein PN498_04580 [Oscillatoria sp. CS-180]|uniref:hypothetical protein n=1 Tax=Oscillatoria sp. CS-180 TaxID=3021720 RepID=UPI0023300E2D|nr:hypothetical protein [Oscillatoria sp. CS-180]MDB9525253.1 hypothetical protein [Oscillatoria sp. CS-180]